MQDAGNELKDLCKIAVIYAALSLSLNENEYDTCSVNAKFPLWLLVVQLRF